jgi:tetratricopeptide (TPR) repeat protein
MSGMPQEPAEAIGPPHPGPAGAGALRQFLRPTTSLLLEASRHPAGAGAIGAMALLALAWPLPSALAAEAGSEIEDYLLFALFAGAALFLYVVLRIADRGGPGAPVAGAPRGEAAAGPPAGSDAARLKAACWLELGDDRLRQGDQPLGEAAYRQALRAFGALGDRAGEAQILRRLGHLTRVRGDLQESRRLYGDAREGFRQAGERYGEASCLIELGRVGGDLGDYHLARDAFGDARQMFAGILCDLAGTGRGSGRATRSAGRLVAAGDRIPMPS